jgi:predicted nucleic acid-binding protein
MGNPDRERCLAIDAWKILAEVDIATTPEVERLAVELESVGLKPLDALHLASAITAKAHIFLTTDKGILRKMKSESRISVLDPLDFIDQQDEEDDEN